MSAWSGVEHARRLRGATCTTLPCPCAAARCSGVWPARVLGSRSCRHSTAASSFTVATAAGVSPPSWSGLGVGVGVGLGLGVGVGLGLGLGSGLGLGIGSGFAAQLHSRGAHA